MNTQEKAIINLYERYPDRYFTPAEVHNRTMPTAPITSCRRAMTNLTTQGVLMKMKVKAPGDYGRPTHTWGYVGPLFARARA